MKGQLIEMLFYPHILIVLMLFFSNTVKEELSELSVIKEVLEASDTSIYQSNLQLLNCSRDHIVEFCKINPGGFSEYGIRRLVVERGSVKELILSSEG